MIQELEEKIEKCEQDTLRVSSDFVKLNAIMKEKNLFESELEDKMERYLALCEIADRIVAYENANADS